MSRPAAAVHRVIKAYDVRGLVGEELDEAFVADVGGAFARLVRDERRRAGRHRLRHASEFAGAGGGVRRRRGRPGPRRRPHRAGVHRSAVLRVGSAGLPGRDVHRQPQPGRLQRHQAVPRRRQAGRQGHRPGRHQRRGDRRCARLRRRRAAPSPTATCSPSTASSCGRWSTSRDCARCGSPSTPATAWPATPRPRCSGRSRRSRCCRCTSNSTARSPTMRPTRWTRPTWSTCRRTSSTTGADIGLAFDGDADRCFVVDEIGHPVSPSAVTALVAARELKREIGATVIHNLITSRAVPELVVERGGTPVRSRVGHSYIKALMADTGAIFGGEHSAHYYFRDFWGADSGMLAALHVLAALGEQDRPLSELMADYQRYEASGEINFTVTDAAACVDAVLRSFGTRHPLHRPPRRRHRRPGRRQLVQPAHLQHRAAAATQRRGPQHRGSRRDRRRRWPSRSLPAASRRRETPRDRHRLPPSTSTTPTACSPPTATGCCGRRRWRARRCGPPRPRSTKVTLDPLRSDQPPRTVIWVAGRGAAETARGDAGRGAGRVGGGADRRRRRGAAVDRCARRAGRGRRRPR